MIPIGHRITSITQECEGDNIILDVIDSIGYRDRLLIVKGDKYFFVRLINPNAKFVYTEEGYVKTDGALEGIIFEKIDDMYVLPLICDTQTSIEDKRVYEFMIDQFKIEVAIDNKNPISVTINKEPSPVIDYTVSDINIDGSIMSFKINNTSIKTHISYNRRFKIPELRLLLGVDKLCHSLYLTEDSGSYKVVKFKNCSNFSDELIVKDKKFFIDFELDPETKEYHFILFNMKLKLRIENETILIKVMLNDKCIDNFIV